MNPIRVATSRVPEISFRSCKVTSFLRIVQISRAAGIRGAA